MKSILGFVFAFVAFVIVMLMIRLGAFQPVTIESHEAGPFKIVYRHHNGAYHKIVPVLESVEKWAAENAEPCKTAFGEYLEEDRLNSNGGCLVEKDWSGKLKDDLAYREIPRRLYVVADFEGAPSIGPQKVYPRAKKYIAEQKLKLTGPVIEMYERVSDTKITTHYFFPVEK
jgi:AraC family transcriptional regulator